MIGYLKGDLITAADGKVILSVGGVGFEVGCSAAAYGEITANGGGELYTYTAVKEDDISLYGFISVEEKEMFLKLISVSGVGPKMGITVLSSMSIADLACKIATSDVKGLSAVKGLGKKTAERIILELREKVSATSEEKSPQLREEAVNEDALIALMSLGLKRQEAVQALKEAASSGASSIEELISGALKRIG